MTQGGSAATNPGNFANRPKEEVQAIASKGGKASSTSAENNPGNFANRPKEEVQAIASKGGKASGGSGSASAGADDDEYVPEQTQSSGNQGGSASNNPGNFANRDKDEVREIAAKGGRASGQARSTDDE